MNEHHAPEHTHNPHQSPASELAHKAEAIAATAPVHSDPLKAAAPDARKQDIENRFTYHAPKNDQQERYVKLREKAKELALLIVEITPYSREQSLAITELETAIMFANASIARNE